MIIHSKKIVDNKKNPYIDEISRCYIQQCSIDQQHFYGLHCPSVPRGGGLGADVLDLRHHAAGGPLGRWAGSKRCKRMWW